MEDETLITLSNTSPSKKSIDLISILVVDDDTTCLSIVAAILKKFKYEVVTVKHPNDALCTLRIKRTAFDLVVSDVHMPDMNGFELQQAIAREFNLPVVLMSADDKEGVALKGLESGAAFFIVKPVCPDDLRDLWQFAVMKKKSEVVIEEETEDETSTESNNSYEMALSANSSVNEDMVHNKKVSSKRNPPRKESSHDKKGESYQSSSQKKPKVIWTNSLHNRFLEAIRSIGLDRAVPKKILEVMNVPGLTRENVASHLQKYRIFLRRVSDASYKLQYSADKGLTRNFRSKNLDSSSATSPSTLTLNRFSKLHYQNPGQSHVTSSITQSGLFGQSRLLSNKRSLVEPNIQTINPIHQNNGLCVRLAQYNEVLSSHKNIGSSLNNLISSDIPSKNYTYQTNYVGYSISNIKHLTLSGNKDKYGSLSSRQGTINLANDNINLDQLAENVGNSISFLAHNKDGEHLSDVDADYRMLLLPPDVNVGENHEPASFSPILDLSEFDILSTQQTLEEGNLGTSFAGQVSINQNQAGQNRGETVTSSNYYGSMNQLVDNRVPSIYQTPNYMQQCSQGLVNPQEFETSSQLNKIVVIPHHERDDDDFLESLLAPFGEDQSLEGI